MSMLSSIHQMEDIWQLPMISKKLLFTLRGKVTEVFHLNKKFSNGPILSDWMGMVKTLWICVGRKIVRF